MFFKKQDVAQQESAQRAHTHPPIIQSKLMQVREHALALLRPPASLSGSIYRAMVRPLATQLQRLDQEEEWLREQAFMLAARNQTEQAPRSHPSFIDAMKQSVDSQHQQ